MYYEIIIVTYNFVPFWFIFIAPILEKFLWAIALLTGTTVVCVHIFWKFCFSKNHLPGGFWSRWLQILHPLSFLLIEVSIPRCTMKMISGQESTVLCWISFWTSVCNCFSDWIKILSKIAIWECRHFHLMHLGTIASMSKTNVSFVISDARECDFSKNEKMTKKVDAYKSTLLTQGGITPVGVKCKCKM